MSSSGRSDISNSPGLRAAQFHRIAEAGFNDPCNSYPHAMCWFRDHLYVGTTRCVLHLLYNRFDAMKAWPVFPIKPPKNVYRDLDIRAHIWRYAPRTGEWLLAHRSPMTKSSDGEDIPYFQGVRNMVVYQSDSDAAPCLYALTWSPQKGPGPTLLRSEDGAQFDYLPMAGALAGQFSTFRPLVEFRGRLFTAPTGRTGSANSAGVAMVLETTDPRSSRWTQANEDNFGDPHNETVFEMAVFNDHLYAGTLNRDGFQLWKTKAEGAPPYRWTCVLTRGAERGPTNEGVGSLCVFDGALYVGSVINNGGYDRKYGIGPAPVELIRVHPDDSWDLVMGDGRLTPGGLRLPISGLGAGFDKFFNSYLWRMCAHEGWLYAGTFAWSSLLHFIPRDKWPDAVKSLLDTARSHLIMSRFGGFDLWRSRNGTTWIPVTRNGFGNFYNWGVRTMASTPAGLFVGVANPFGPEVATARNAEWKYEPNPRGGCEVWLGTHASPPPSSLMPAAEVRAPRPPAPAGRRDADAFVDSVVAEFYGHSGHFAIGCWTDRTRHAADACDNLVDETLALLPAKNGTILDFGCGAGATTLRLLKQCPAAAVCGCPLDKRAPRVAAAEAAGIAWRARAGDRVADAVLTIESLSRRTDGLRRLRDAIRAVKPGGYLIGAQALSAHPQSPWRERSGWRSRPILDAEAFAGLLERLGLIDVRAIDRTPDCWTSFRSRLAIFLWEKRLDNELDEDLQRAVQQRLYGAIDPLHAYVLFCARRPGP